ncbi:Cholinergic receptor [Mactra antiquata]
MIWIITTISLILLVSTTHGQSMQDEYNLHLQLLNHSNYSKHIRPYIDKTLPTIVNITFDLVSIRELDEILGKLSIVGILWMRWMDPRLAWNPADYGNVIYTKLEMKRIWKPDLIIAHPIEPISAVGFDHYHYPLLVYYNGLAIWSPGDVMTTTCNINVAYYPFDTQICTLTFIQWGSTNMQVALHAVEKEVSTKFFVGNGEWDLIKAYAKEDILENNDYLYPTYNIVIELKRRPAFVVVNVVLPILFMGVLNVLVFVLPPQSGERISYSMTVLLAIAVFLTLVGDNLPKTSEPMSTICYFLLTNLVLSSVIMIVTIINLNIFHRSELRPVPTRLAKLVLIMRCKRSRRNKVQDIEMTEDDVPEIVLKKEKDKLENATDKTQSKKMKWAVHDADELNDVTWQDVSRMFDIIFGLLAFVWLTFSAAAFFGMVSTQSVPGV